LADQSQISTILEVKKFIAAPAHSLPRTHSRALTPAHSLPRTHSRSLAHSLARTRSGALAQVHSLTRTRSGALAHTYNLTRTRSRALAHAHSLTPTRSRALAHAHWLTRTISRGHAHAHLLTRTRTRSRALLTRTAHAHCSRAGSAASWLQSQLTHTIILFFDFFQTYVLTMADMDVGSELLEKIMSFHKPEVCPRPASGAKKLQPHQLYIHLLNLVSSFTKFAKRLYLFQSLCVEDKIKLVTRNAFLFVQYLLARYYSAPTGLDQLSWILDSRVPKTSIEELYSLEV
jgi:hypothetical protein